MVEINGPEKQDIYLQTALKAGQIALGNGSETARCNEIMKTILSCSEEKDQDTSVVSTSLFARLGKQVGMVTIKKWDTVLNRLCRVNDISRELSSGKLAVGDALEKLNSIEEARLYGFFVRMAGFIILGAAMALLNNGSAFDCISAGFCGAVLSLTEAGFSRIRMHSFAVVMIKALIMVLAASFAAAVFRGGVNINVVVISSMISFLPGLAMTNAVRDTLQGDYVSGTSRLMEAAVRAIALSIGVVIGLLGISLIPAGYEALTNNADPLAFEGPLKYVVSFAAALFFSAGFCVIFEVPVRMAIAGSIIGAAGKVFCIFLIGDGADNIFSTFAAMVLVAVPAQICARAFKAPTIPFLISGIMAMAPGSILYNSILNIVLNEYRAGAVKLLDTLLVAGAIAFAIFLVDTVFQMISKAAKKS